MSTGIRSAIFLEVMKDLKAGHRLHIVGGTPWLTALGAYMSEDDAEVWQVEEDYDEGDYFLTALGTAPRALLCLERTTRAGSPRSARHEVDTVARFRRLITTTDVEAATGFRFPSLGAVSADVALVLLTAITDIDVHGGGAGSVVGSESCTSLSTAHRAIALHSSEGRCQACNTEFTGILGRYGVHGLEVHLDRRSAAPSDVSSVVLCAACHKIVHAIEDDRGADLELSPYAELRYAWREPCPSCGAHRAMPVLWGMPAAPPPEDVVVGGCVLPPHPEDFVCGSCGHRWQAHTDDGHMGQSID